MKRTFLLILTLTLVFGLTQEASEQMVLGAIDGDLATDAAVYRTNLQSKKLSNWQGLLSKTKSPRITQLRPVGDNYSDSPLQAKKPIIVTEACGETVFDMIVSEMPDMGGRQRVEVKVSNNNKFRIHVSFKLVAISDEGKNYTSTAAANGFNAGTSDSPTNFSFKPFADEDLNRSTYPQIAEIGIAEVDIRNVEHLPRKSGAYSRGEKIVGSCGGNLKAVPVIIDPSEGWLTQSYAFREESAPYVTEKTGHQKISVENGILTLDFEFRLAQSGGENPMKGDSTRVEKYSAPLRDLDGQNLKIDPWFTPGGMITLRCKAEANCADTEYYDSYSGAKRPTIKYRSNYIMMRFSSMEFAKEAASRLKAILK